MMEAGIVDPTKVSRSALQNAASIASVVLTTEALVADKKEETPDEQKPDNDSEEQPKDGCSAMMGAGAFAVLVTTLSLGVVSCKKKEN